MEILDEEIQKLKEQMIRQIESTFPENKKDSVIKQIKAMNNEQFIDFLRKNKLIDSQNAPDTDKNFQKENFKESPFRLIIEEKIPFYRIDENKDSVAVLEINPISKAHILIIPKKQVKELEKIPSSIFTLAKKIVKRIKTNFKPKEILISSSIVLGEGIVNILPVYSNENSDSPRQQISKEELEGLKKILEKKFKPKIPKKPKIKKIQEEKLWLPKRIP